MYIRPVENRFLRPNHQEMMMGLGLFVGWSDSIQRITTELQGTRNVISPLIYEHATMKSTYL